MSQKYYRNMYGNIAVPKPVTQSPEKNANRVIGGLKAQNAHTITVEIDGEYKVLPRLEYVTQLENQLKDARSKLVELDKKMKKLISANNNMMDKIRELDRNQTRRI